jgi:phosphate transport system substrate-binding protein
MKCHKSCLRFLSFLLPFILIIYFFSLPSYAEELKIGGAGSALGSMKLLAAAFEKRTPGLKVIVLPSLGSIGGIKAVSKRAIDIGLIGRPLDEKERKLNLVVTEYARTPVIFVTDTSVGITNLNEQDVIRIFKGETEKWPKGERIRMILRQPAESNAIAVRQISSGMGKAMDIAMSRPWRVVALTDQETLDIAEKTHGAFSFCTLAQVLSEKRRVNILSYNGISPIKQDRPNESYPIFKTHAMVTQPDASPIVRKFIEFVKSARARAILEKNGDIQITGKKEH